MASNFGLPLTAFVFLMIFVSAVFAAQTAVNLGTAGHFVILSKSGISTTGTTSIVGDIGVSPIDSTAITGFGLILDPSTQFSTSSLVTGKIYAADYSPPTPATMTAAVSDMETAYTDAAGRTLPDATELGAGNIDGMTLAPGLYKWGTGVTIPTGVTLSGGPNDVWIFQIAQNLDVGNGAIITLSGGAQAKNIFWQVAGQATLGTTSDFKGIILSQTAIVMNTGATLNGRELAQTAVTLNANSVTAPTSLAPPANACTNGQAQCLNGQTAQTCVNGAWTNTACPAGQQCTNGQCVSPPPATLPACTNGQTQCLNGQTAQTCVNGAWTNTACPAGQQCTNGQCVSPPPSSTAPPSNPPSNPGANPGIIPSPPSQPSGSSPPSNPGANPGIIPSPPSQASGAVPPKQNAQNAAAGLPAGTTPPAANSAPSPAAPSAPIKAPESNLPIIVAGAAIAVLAAGSYYYFKVRKK